MIILILSGCFDFVYLSADDTGSPSDSGSADSGSADSGSGDSGSADSGSGDSGGGGGGGGGGLGPSWSWGQQLTVEDAEASLTGEAYGDAAGHGLQRCGDLNGDGVGDLAIGAPYNHDGGANAGKIYFVFGRSDGWSLDEPLAPYPSIIGAAEGEQLSDVIPVGDVNDDGLVDLAMDRTIYTVSEDDSVPLLYGDSGTWASSRSISDADVLLRSTQYGFGYTTPFALGDMDGDGIDDWAVHGIGEGGELAVISGADLSAEVWIPEDVTFWVQGDGGADHLADYTLRGDLNGDGLSDVVAHHSGWDDLMIFLGRSSGRPLGEVDTDVMDGQILANMMTQGIVGDVNDDGSDDLIVSSDDPDNGVPTGSYLYFGRDDWDTAMDLADADVAITGDRVHSGARLGDIDGDGITDFGLVATDPANRNSSDVYLFLGQEAWAAEVDVGDAAAHITSAATVNGALRLPSEDMLGDVNGDGLSDVLLSAANTDVGEISSAGGAYLYTGRTSWEPELDTDDADLSFVGSVTFQNLAYPGRVAVADVNADGYDDLAFASVYHPAPDAPDAEVAEGQVFLFFGAPGP